eukprot:14639313-Alexandrium_andersonii.AAC.1
MLRVVPAYQHLGSRDAFGADTAPDAKQKAGKATGAVHDLQSVLRSPHLPCETKVTFMRAFVVSRALYNA